MSLFGNIENNIVELLKALANNEDFLKLISIDDPDALNMSPSDTFTSLFNNRLFMRAKVPTATSEEKSFVSIYEKSGGKVDRNNIYHYDTFLFVDIICHNNLWDLKNNKERPYRIMDVLETTFRDVDIKSVRGNMILQSYTIRYYSDEFIGYTMTYKYTHSAGCNNG